MEIKRTKDKNGRVWIYGTGTHEEVEGTYRGIDTHYISNKDLTALKHHFNREQDKKDLKRLEKKKTRGFDR